MPRSKKNRKPRQQSTTSANSNHSRRDFLKLVTGAGAGLALAGTALPAFADRHASPSPNSLTYLDRRTYIHNMELIAHFAPGEDRGGKMQMMSVGNRRYLLQQGDVIDVSDARKPTMYNPKGFQGKVSPPFDKRPPKRGCMRQFWQLSPSRRLSPSPLWGRVGGERAESHEPRSCPSAPKRHDRRGRL